VNVQGPLPESVAETSLALLTRAQAGDAQALEALIKRFLPRLKSWISNRLPGRHRDLSDTDDLVQETLIRTLRVLNDFEVRHEAGLQAYLREAVWNRLRQEIRRSGRRGTAEDLSEFLPSLDPSPLERAIGIEALERYETALRQLDPDERSAVVGRLEFGYSYPELAQMLNRRTPDAARKLVERAVPKLAELMKHAR
jgi:RNA polymerase sigma-70 factor (ECF subfamily)